MTSSSEAAMKQPGEIRTISLRGRKLKVLAGSDETEGAFALIEAEEPPGYVGPPRKFHNNLTRALYVLEGEITVEVGDQVHKASKGDFFLIPRGTTYHQSNPGTKPARILILYSPGGPDKYLVELAEVAEKHGYPPPPDIMRPIEEKYGIVLVGPRLTDA